MAKRDYEPDWEELAKLRKEMLEIDADIQRRRARYLAFVETISHLDRLAKAEAWLGYVASHVENFSDQEALVCRVSRGIPSEDEIKELIERWKGAVEDARERYALDPMSFDSERGFFKPEQPKRADDPIKVVEITSTLLHNFWGHYDHEAPIIDATMLRTAEWCRIGGFDEWWERLANDEKESMLKGGLSALRGFRWPFHNVPLEICDQPHGEYAQARARIAGDTRAQLRNAVEVPRGKNERRIAGGPMGRSHSRGLHHRICVLEAFGCPEPAGQEGIGDDSGLPAEGRLVALLGG
jgi:hypothetical protein